MKKKIRVLVTEDSVFIQKLLVEILESDQEIEVVGAAANGRDAVKMVKDLNPDLVTMDIRMPVMDGFEATQIIMSEVPKPILVISSSVNSDDLNISFNAIKAGALDIIEKPRGSLQADYSEIGKDIIRRVKMLAEIRVFRHLSPKLQKSINWNTGTGKEEQSERAIAIGASTGGPSALHSILRMAAGPLPVPVFVTQHISEGFGGGYVEWLKRNTCLDIKIAENGEYVKAGTVYFAPDRGLLEVRGKSRIRIRPPDDKEKRMTIDTMMLSVAESYREGTVGIILTGMGNDGVAGMSRIKSRGGRTIAQDEKTSVVYGMPKAALEGGAADTVLPLSEIFPAIVKILKVK